jgi:uncharacterized membrane-anchored protein
MWNMMQRFCWLILTLTMLAVCIYAASMDQRLAIQWADYEIRLSALMVFLLLMVGFWVLHRLLHFFWWVGQTPKRIATYLKQSAMEKTIALLNQEILAFTQGDYCKVERLYASLKQQSALPYSMVGSEILRGFSAVEEGDYVEAQQHFDRLLNDKTSRKVALRGKLYIAKKQHDLTAIEKYLTLSLQEFGPEEWFLLDLIDYYKAKGDLKKAIATLERAKEKALIDANAIDYQKSSLYFESAKGLLQQGESAEATKCLKKALQFYSKNVPALILYSELLVHQGKDKAAFAGILRAWAEQPCPELVRSIETLFAKDPPEKQYKRYEQCIALHHHHPIPHLLLAKAALRMGQTGIARKHAGIAMQHGRNAELCMLMAELELKAGANNTVVLSWIEASQNEQRPLPDASQETTPYLLRTESLLDFGKLYH